MQEPIEGINCKNSLRKPVTMNIALYLASSNGNEPFYKEEVQNLARFIGRNNNTMIYGGSTAGLMGAAADAVLEAGGHVIGVEPGFFVEEYEQHEGIDELIVTETIAERRLKMIDLADAFIAFPGGTGTLEEIAEVICQRHLSMHQKPVIIYHLNGFYDPLLALLDQMVAAGFVTKENRDLIKEAKSVEDVERILGRNPER